MKPNGGHFTINGKPFFIYSGEIHYFRIPPDQWNDRLKKAKAAGLNAVASYIPWMLHEPEEGKFDFNGRTWKNLDVMRFIKLVQENGMYFIARIGPVSNGEMINEGLPSWLLENYPGAFNRSSDGKAAHQQGAPAYNSKVFLKKVEAWYDQVIPLLTPLQHPEGNIIVFQLCNEIGCVNWVGKMPDYTPDAQAMYRDFILKRYKKVKAINSAYGISLKDISALKQPDKNCKRECFRKWLDWGDFYRHYYATYYSKLSGMARKRGIRTLLIANIPQFYDFDVRGRGLYSTTTTSIFRDFSKLTEGVIFGGAYQMRRLDYENFHDILLTSEHVKSITAEGLPAICAELQSGVLADRPRLYPPDVELNLKTSMISGLNAVNCYMFAGGTNQRGMGQFGPYHEWQAPVDSHGALKSHYEPMQRFGKLVSQIGEQIAVCRKQTDLTLGFYEDHLKTEYLEGELAEELYNRRNRYYYDGLARLLSLAGYSYSATDINNPIPEDVKFLAVCSFSLMSVKAQQNLADFVKRGGRLLLSGELLICDEYAKKAPVFLKEMGLSAVRIPSMRTVMLGKREIYLDNQPVDCFKDIPKSCKAIASCGNKPCGLSGKFGKGKLILLGFNLWDKFDYFVEIMDELMKDLGVVKKVICSTRDLVTVLREHEGRGFLFAGNFHEDKACGRVGIDIGAEKISFDLSLNMRSGVILPLNQLVGKSGELVYSTAEILHSSEKKGTLKLELFAPTETGFELVFRNLAVKSVSVKHGKANLVKTGKLLVKVTVLHGKGEGPLNELLIKIKRA
ncbi:MAG: beta-galactosidase [Candidatus Wallbacteria bacterium]|nr:beta-galactosidase [Candidatus Wallbacteria bacterium]